MALKTDTHKTHKLRHQCHVLMDVVFEGTSKATRYRWLDQRGYSHHMSQMQDVQLECLKVELEVLEDNEFRIYKKRKKH